MDVAVYAQDVVPLHVVQLACKVVCSLSMYMPCRIIGSVHSRVRAFMCSRVRASVRSESSERSPAILRASAREWLYRGVYWAVIIASGMICLRVDAQSSEDESGCGIFLSPDRSKLYLCRTNRRLSDKGACPAGRVRRSRVAACLYPTIVLSRN